MDNNSKSSMATSNMMGSQMLTAQGNAQAAIHQTAAMYDMCKRHLNQFVQLTTYDNAAHTGIITHVDQDNVHLAIPNWGNEMWSSGMQRAMYGHSGYPGGWHSGGYYGHGRPPYYGGSYRPFNRGVLPLATLVALSLLPWY